MPDAFAVTTLNTCEKRMAGRLITRVILSNYQARSVEAMVREGDPHVQALLEAMTALLRYYAKTNENEKKTVLGMFDVEIPFSLRPQDRITLHGLADAAHGEQHHGGQRQPQRLAAAAQRRKYQRSDDHQRHNRPIHHPQQQNFPGTVPGHRHIQHRNE